MANKNKILVIGSSSYLGRHLSKYLNKKNIILTHYSKPFLDSVFFDLKKNNISDILEKNTKISKAIILAGIHNYQMINKDSQTSYDINVLQIKNVLKSLKSYGIMPIYTSSDNVFDGTKGNYQETDRTNPQFNYANQKVEIEKFILNEFDKYQIYRISKIVDTNPDSNTLISNWIRQIKNNEKIICADDNSFSPIDVEDLCVFIKKLIQLNENGIFHLSSNENLSRKKMLTELLKKTSNHIKYNHSIIYKNLNEFEGSEKQPVHISLNSEKAIQRTNFYPKKYSQILDKILLKAF